MENCDKIINAFIDCKNNCKILKCNYNPDAYKHLGLNQLNITKQFNDSMQYKGFDVTKNIK